MFVPETMMGGHHATASRALRGSAVNGRPNQPTLQATRRYIDVVTVADVPDNYDERLTTALAGFFDKLRLRIFERHDLVLAKIVRNNDRDRADVAAIAGGPGLDVDVLRDRYSRSTGQNLAGRNAKTSRSSSGSKSSRKGGGAGRIDDLSF